MSRPIRFRLSLSRSPEIPTLGDDRRKKVHTATCPVQAEGADVHLVARDGEVVVCEAKLRCPVPRGQHDATGVRDDGGEAILWNVEGLHSDKRISTGGRGNQVSAASEEPDTST